MCFSKNFAEGLSYSYIFYGSRHPEVKKVVLKILQNYQKNSCAGAPQNSQENKYGGGSFLIKSQVLFLFKKRFLAQLFSYDFSEICKNTASVKLNVNRNSYKHFKLLPNRRRGNRVAGLGSFHLGKIQFGLSQKSSITVNYNKIGQ